MRILNRYLLRQNLFYILVCLGLGVIIYLLTDLFDRLDDFLEAGVSGGSILMYYLAKTPLIVSQILPVVFLVSVLLQLSIMGQSRELLALQAGGISLLQLGRFFVGYGLVLCLVQLLFSQVMGVAGEQTAQRIWKEQVRNAGQEWQVIRDVWFWDAPYIVELNEALPAEGRGVGATLYQMASDGHSLERIIRAEKFRQAEGIWQFEQTEDCDPAAFVCHAISTLALPLKQDLRSFLVADPRQDPSTFSLWQLGAVIHRLKATGSNVDGLRAAWHMKLAYAFSLVVMGLLSLALVSWRDNVYLNILLGLVLTFAYYSLTLVGLTAGEKGIVPPLIGAWAGNILFSTLAVGRLAWCAWPFR